MAGDARDGASRDCCRTFEWMSSDWQNPWIGCRCPGQTSREKRNFGPGPAPGKGCAFLLGCIRKESDSGAGQQLSTLRHWSTAQTTDCQAGGVEAGIAGRLSTTLSASATPRACERFDSRARSGGRKSCPVLTPNPSPTPKARLVHPQDPPNRRPGHNGTTERRTSCGTLLMGCAAWCRAARRQCSGVRGTRPGGHSS